MELNEGTKRALEILTKRLNTYSKCELAFALIKDKGGYKINSGVIRFLHQKDEGPKELLYTYDNLTILRKIVGATEANELVNKIVKEDKLNLKDFGDIVVETNNINSEGYPQKYIPGFGIFGWAYTQYEWPSIRIIYTIKRETAGTAPTGQLVDYNSPLYPDFIHAIADIFKGPIYNPVNTQIEIIIPDFRARIRKVKMLSKKIRAEIECRDIAEKELVAKYYIQNIDNSAITSDNITLEESSVIIPYDESFLIQLNLIQQSTNEDIDNKSVYLNRYNLQSWQEIDEVAYKDDVIKLIKEGENEQVERKEKLSDRFLPTVGAFANTKGGIIALGVSDDGQIKGSNESEGRIRDLILSNFDPPIEFRPKMISHEGTNLVIVEIAEGKNKPYFLKEKGIFTRKGDRNRHMTRAELDELSKSKNQTFGTFPT